MDLTLREKDVAESKAMMWSKAPVEAMVILFAWLVLLFIPRKWDRIPNSWPILRYFQDAKWGLNGDPYWVNPELSDHPSTAEKARSWFWRLAWVVRNSNVWDHDHGLDASNIAALEWAGESRVGNRPLVEGDLVIHAWDKAGKRYWAYYSVHVNPDRPDKCKRSYIGWKLQEALHNFQRTGSYVGTGDSNMPAVYSVNPRMGYSK